MKFWDTSALMPLCLKEPQTARVQKLIEQDGDVAAWWGTLIEGYSAIARLRREEVFTADEECQARQVLNRLAGQWAEIRPSNPVRDQAARVLLLHPLPGCGACLGWRGNNKYRLRLPRPPIA